MAKYLNKDGLSYLWGKISTLLGNYYTKTEIESRLTGLSYTQMHGTMWVELDGSTGKLVVTASDETNVTDAAINATTGKLELTITTTEE